MRLARLAYPAVLRPLSGAAQTGIPLPPADAIAFLFPLQGEAAGVGHEDRSAAAFFLPITGSAIGIASVSREAVSFLMPLATGPFGRAETEGAEDRTITLEAPITAQHELDARIE